ncbi:MAG: M81 family metallopeptidase [Firmicutes bacterium]|nr:M81 family metallopeptidase [Bacillota bacterium]
MRIAVGGMSHETNTFTYLKTSLEDFQIAEGDAMLEIPEAVRNTSLQGIIETLKANDVEIVPTLYARTLPSGTIERDAYENMKGRLLEGLANGGDLDAVVLAMHGSMFVEDVGDADGDLLESIRNIVGPNIPIICALDLHGTITEKMVSNANAFVGYRTAPHIDTKDTGEKAAKLALMALSNSLELSMSWVSIPMLVSGEQSETKSRPTSDIVAQLRHMPSTGGDIISSSIFLGFPWADVPYNCVSSIVVTAKEATAAGEREAKRLAQLIWDKRHEFTFTTEAYSLEKCLDIAENETSRPVIIADGGDNPTAGASEDLTNALEVMIKKEVKHALFAVVVDKLAYEKCVAARAGSYVDLKLGRVNPTEEPALPLAVRAYVESIGIGKGIPSAVIRIDDIRAIITTTRTDVYDPEFLTDLGLDPMDYKVIVVKSGYLSPAYTALTKRPMLALTPGDTNLLLESIPYKVTPRPIHPLDKDFDWEPKVQ